MINHIRTLLFNQQRATDSVLDDFGGQYVPPQYRPVALPTYLQLFRQKLFGAAPDRDMLNYRVHQYLRVIQSTELQEYLYYHDSRVTYPNRPRPELFDAVSYVPNIYSEAGNITQLQVYGQPAAPDPLGKMYFLYRVELSAGDQVQINLTSQLAGPAVSAVFVNGLSQEFKLPESGYLLRIPEQDNAIWTVTIRNQPQWDLGQIILLLENLGEPNYLQLFGVAPQEPYLTFRNIWNDHYLLPYRLGAFLLAVAFRTGEIVAANRTSAGVGELIEETEPDDDPIFGVFSSGSNPSSRKAP